MKKSRGILMGFCILTIISCRSMRLEKEFSLNEREFLSKVRYIITKEERNIFFKIQPSKRETFIEEFWKKRDPDPSTEKNEFKDQYFLRIDEANHLFGKGGWLQDRGMVYILLGPPETKYTFPMGERTGDYPYEIWYYGMFPIVFIDYNWNGDYRLEPLSAYQIAQINRAQIQENPRIKLGKVPIDFHLETRISESIQGRIPIIIRVPYKNIGLIQKENLLKTFLSLKLEIKDSEKKIIWEDQKNYEISFSLEDVKKLKNTEYTIEIELKLKKGDYTLLATLENKTNKDKGKKEISFRVEK